MNAFGAVGNMTCQSETGRKGIDVRPEANALDGPFYCDLSPFNH